MTQAVSLDPAEKGWNVCHACDGARWHHFRQVPSDPSRRRCRLPYNAGMVDFREALLWHMERHGTGVADLARGAGVSQDVIKKLRSRDKGSTKAETAQKIAAYYGKDVRSFQECIEPGDSDAFSALAGLLTPEERREVVREMRRRIEDRGSRSS